MQAEEAMQGARTDMSGRTVQKESNKSHRSTSADSGNQTRSKQEKAGTARTSTRRRKNDTKQNEPKSSMSEAPGHHFSTNEDEIAHSQSSSRRARSKVLNRDLAYQIYLAKNNYPENKSMESTFVSAQFGVSSKTVRDIWDRRTWTEATKSLWTESERIEFERQTRRCPGRPFGSKDSKPRKKRTDTKKQAVDVNEAIRPDDMCASQQLTLSTSETVSIPETNSNPETSPFPEALSFTGTSPFQDGNSIPDEEMKRKIERVWQSCSKRPLSSSEGSGSINNGDEGRTLNEQGETESGELSDRTEGFLLHDQANILPISPFESSSSSKSNENEDWMLRSDTSAIQQLLANQESTDV